MLTAFHLLQPTRGCGLISKATRTIGRTKGGAQGDKADSWAAAHLLRTYYMLQTPVIPCIILSILWILLFSWIQISSYYAIPET